MLDQAVLVIIAVCFILCCSYAIFVSRRRRRGTSEKRNAKLVVVSLTADLDRQCEQLTQRIKEAYPTAVLRQIRYDVTIVSVHTNETKKADVGIVMPANDSTTIREIRDCVAKFEGSTTFFVLPFRAYGGDEFSQEVTPHQLRYVDKQPLDDQQCLRELMANVGTCLQRLELEDVACFNAATLV